MRQVRAVGRLRESIAAVVAAVAVVVVLSACTPQQSQPTVPTLSANASATPTAAAKVPVLQPKMSAEKNKAFFDFVNRKTVSQQKDPSGRQFVDALISAGFSKKEMQVTADRTTINLTPGSIQFSAKINGHCLIGQFGTDVDGYHSEVTPALSTGRCLIGDTRPIDW